jgi:hypothetical protein
VVVYLPPNFEKDWPTLLPDCFAWFPPRTDNSEKLANFQIFNIAKIGYVLRVISLKVTL